MSYHKFSNLGEKLHNDLSSKVMKDIIDKEQDLSCNCPKKREKANGTCLHNDQCQQSMVVYKLKCKLCKHSYVGKAQNGFKKITAQHIYDTRKVLDAGRSKYGDDWRGSGGYYSRADLICLQNIFEIIAETVGPVMK